MSDSDGLHDQDIQRDCESLICVSIKLDDLVSKHGKELKPAVYEFPSELDKETAFAKLETMSISIDKWTKEQETYARAYAEGT